MTWLKRAIKSNPISTAGYGRCDHCNESWATAERHTTKYNEYGGCFPLCESCFWKVNRDQIISAYHRLMMRWRASGSWVPPESASHVVNCALRERGFEDGWQERPYVEVPA